MAGFSESGLQRWRDALAARVESGEVPGIVAALERRGELNVETLGTLALDGEPVRRDSIFRVASMTKPVTAVAALILVEERRLRLDDAVDELLPELADRRVLVLPDAPLDETVPAERPITVADLLTFTPGIGIAMVPPGTYPIQRALDELELGQGAPAPSVPPPPDEWIARLGTLPLMHQPGERWLYHTGADILGVLIARAAGKPFDAFLRERVFAPLGMRDTGFAVPPEHVDRLATSYAANAETGELEVRDPAAGGQWSRPPAFPSGGGGLVSTVDDFLAFGRMLLARGGGLLSRASVELMTSDRLTPAQKAGSSFVPGWFDANGWGFGLSVRTARDELGRSAGSFGWDGGLGTSWAADPATGLNAVLLTQRMMTSPAPPPVFADFWRGAYEALDG